VGQRWVKGVPSTSPPSTSDHEEEVEEEKTSHGQPLEGAVQAIKTKTSLHEFFLHTLDMEEASPGKDTIRPNQNSLTKLETLIDLGWERSHFAQVLGKKIPDKVKFPSGWMNKQIKDQLYGTPEDHPIIFANTMRTLTGSQPAPTREGPAHILAVDDIVPPSFRSLSDPDSWMQENYDTLDVQPDVERLNITEKELLEQARTVPEIREALADADAEDAWRDDDDEDRGTEAFDIAFAWHVWKQLLAIAIANGYLQEDLSPDKQADRFQSLQSQIGELTEDHSPLVPEAARLIMALLAPNLEADQLAEPNAGMALAIEYFEWLTRTTHKPTEGDHR